MAEVGLVDFAICVLAIAKKYCLCTETNTQSIHLRNQNYWQSSA